MKANNKKVTIILLSIFFTGLLIMFYPTFSQYWNKRKLVDIVDKYDKIVNNIDKDKYKDFFEEANSYNISLSKLIFPLTEYKKLDKYDDILKFSNDGMIGYISIDKIRVNLPFYHGTDAAILNNSVGHLKGTSFPIGGEGTHAVLSAHRGLPSSRLFTDLNKLEIGDVFTITILDRVLTYQVDKIQVVTPKDTTNLKIEANYDYVTLLTCTPYGINTHRLLVRGTRIDNIIDYNKYITSEAYVIDKLFVSICLAIPILLILVIYIIIKPSNKNKKEEL